jgi:hypothetical protein
VYAARRAMPPSLTPTHRLRSSRLQQRGIGRAPAARAGEDSVFAQSAVCHSQAGGLLEKRTHASLACANHSRQTPEAGKGVANCAQRRISGLPAPRQAELAHGHATVPAFQVSKGTLGVGVCCGGYWAETNQLRHGQGVQREKHSLQMPSLDVLPSPVCLPQRHCPQHVFKLVLEAQPLPTLCEADSWGARKGSNQAPAAQARPGHGGQQV